MTPAAGHLPLRGTALVWALAWLAGTSSTVEVKAADTLAAAGRLLREGKYAEAEDAFRSLGDEVSAAAAVGKIGRAHV
jgi:hypothetical protein